MTENKKKRWTRPRGCLDKQEKDADTYTEAKKVKDEFEAKGFQAHIQKLTGKTEEGEYSYYRVYAWKMPQKE